MPGDTPTATRVRSTGRLPAPTVIRIVDNAPPDRYGRSMIAGVIAPGRVYGPQAPLLDLAPGGAGRPERRRGDHRLDRPGRSVGHRPGAFRPSARGGRAAS